MYRHTWSLFSKISKSCEEQIQKVELGQEEAFNDALAEQHRQTLQEELHQAAPERRRNEEFTALKSTIRDAFDEDTKARAKEFQDAELEQDKSANQTENSRDERFRIASDKRDALFQREREARQERSKLYTDIRDQHIRERRDSRQAELRRLEDSMQKEIDATLRTLLELSDRTEDNEEGRTMVRMAL